VLVELHNGSVLTRPSVFDNVSAVKVFGLNRQLIAIIHELQPGVTQVVDADDPDFASVCKNYGINTKPAVAIEVDQ
jgi:hypothetical protein